MTTQKALPNKIIALCERMDIASFVDAYIRYLRKQGVEIPNIRIINFQVLGNLPRYLKMLEQADGFSNIEKIVIFADAGVKHRETEHFLYKARKNSFLKDFNYELFLFPKKSAAGNWTPGFMEDLLLPVLKHDTAEVEEFYNLRNITYEFLFSVNNCRGKERRLVNHSRNFLYSYFSGTEKFVGMRLGEASAKGAFDLEDEDFKDLREFLTGLGMRELP